MSSGRAERNTRSQQRHESNGASATPRSASSAESLESKDKAESDARRTRQLRKGQDTKSEEATPADVQTEDADQEEDDDEDEDITRCICRKPEYPGPPVPPTTATLSDEPGSLFIQCESCNVWQHGGCVGIMDESMSPENYWCERCRSDLHKIMTGPRGQRYSRYLPVTDPKSVRKKSVRDNDARAPDENKAQSAAQLSSSAKRRSTMNSRSTWEEEENFRKALEESKGGGSNGDHSTSGFRRNKRIREDSDGEAQELKRRRVGSGSVSVSDQEVETGDDASDAAGEPSTGRTEGATRRRRVAAAPNQQEKDLRRKEKDRERDRAEAATKRKGRAERRRGDDSDGAEELPKTNINNRLGSSKILRPAAGIKTPPENNQPGIAKAIPRKNGRNGNKRGKFGRNQNIREREAADPAKAEAQGRNARNAEESTHPEAIGHQNNTLSNGTKPSKPRHMNPNRTSMNELRKRAAGILEFISQVQRDMAGEKAVTSGGTQVNGQSTSPPNGPSVKRIGQGKANNISKLSKEVQGEDGEASEDTAAEGEIGNGADGLDSRASVDEEAFTRLSAKEMMDVLSREVVLWQKDHGKWGER